jgi:hypothetical protein
MNNTEESCQLAAKIRDDGVLQGWCVNTRLKISRTYAQVSGQGANRFACLQELLLWSQGIQKSPGEHASHLCHNPLCCIAQHVIAEPARINQLRKGCLVWVPCPHGDMCGNRKYFVCQHRPACIKYCEGFRDQEHFLREGVYVCFASRNETT